MVSKQKTMNGGQATQVRGDRHAAEASFIRFPVAVLGLGGQRDQVHGEARILERVDAVDGFSGLEIDDSNRAVVHARDVGEPVLDPGAATVW